MVTSERETTTTATDPPLPRLGKADLARLFALAAIYVVAAKVSLLFALVEHNVTPIWPPTGIAVVAFLLLGRRLWPAVFVAAFIVNLPISETWAAALGTAVGNTLAPLLAAEILRRLDFRVELDRTRDAVILVAVALVSMAVSATIGTEMLVFSQAIAGARFATTWFVWWAGDAMGVLIVAPFLFALARRPPGEWPWTRWLEAAVLALVVLATSVVVITADLPLLFLILIPVGFAAWRFELHGAAPAALIACAVATWASSVGRGPFVARPLLHEMLVLQAFNASLAVTSFVFAALVAERRRARAALERAAAELEQRVLDRTGALERANELLEREVAERHDAERLLAQAQEVARVGSYVWDLGTGDVRWSDELYRIHGHEPGAIAVTLETALAQIDPEDRGRIRSNIETALERGDERLPDVEYRLERPNGEMRSVRGSARLTFGEDGRPATMFGTVHDVTEQQAYEREHRIAETLQRALLPQHVPPVTGVEVATRYLSAEEGAHAGGDWYDVIELPGGRVAFVIGDASGHGIAAASAMGQARMTVRAYAIAGDEPATIVSLTSDALDQMHPGELVTLLYVELDTATARARIVAAGHPPPVLLSPAGEATYLEIDAGVPLGLGLAVKKAYAETTVTLEPGAALLLYTDGLIDRPDLGVIDGLEQLRVAVERAEREDLDALCDEVLGSMAADASSDDVALICLRVPAVTHEFHRSMPADPSQLSSLRHALARWLDGRADEEAVDDVVLACSEAVANASEHAYRGLEGTVEIDGVIEGDDVAISIRDHGSWRTERDDDRGRGLTVIRACMDFVAIDRRADGTELRVRRTLRRPGPSASASASAN